MTVTVSINRGLARTRRGTVHLENCPALKNARSGGHWNWADKHTALKILDSIDRNGLPTCRRCDSRFVIEAQAMTERRI
jgi:hypothetical protein